MRTVLNIVFASFVTAQDRTFTITAFPPSGSSVVQVVPATAYLEVLAGLSYSFTLITSSTAFFGTTSAQVNAKIVPFENPTCDASTQSLLAAPFDGLTKPSQLTQLMTRWVATKFDYGANFTVCMNVSSTLTLLPLTIVSRGVTSNTLKMFCLFSPVTPCTVRLPGNQMTGNGDAKLALVSSGSGVCGTSILSVPFDRSTSSTTVSSQTEEVHSLGVLNGAATLSTYKACYCPSFQASGGSAGTLCTELPANFIQTVGTLILIRSSTIDPLTGSATALYPGLRFNLHILCGTGGCSSSTVPRIKVVDSNTFNQRPYFDVQAGCRFALQSELFLGPSNCQTASSTGCSLSRSNSGDSAKVIFSSLQLRNPLKNNVMMQHGFDICFCDSGCSSRENWFYVGSVNMQPLRVEYTFNSVPINRIAVNVSGSIRISGSLSGSFRTSGTQSREMKLLGDPDGTVDPAACLTTPQASSLIMNHDCYSVTNCAVPVVSSKTEQVYGRDLIQITQAGWIAICYCNEQCRTNEQNWLVAGRILVAGPKGDQSWVFPESTPFTMSIDGYGLKSGDSLKIISQASDCWLSAPVLPSAVGSVLFGSSISSVADGFVEILGGSGTVITFGTSHGLLEGDRISISGIATGDSFVNAMFNNDHRVSILSPTKVWIDVQFGPGLFPNSIDLSVSSWRRTSRLDFPDQFSISTPGTYTVCWVGESSAASAGLLVIEADDA